MPLAARLNRSKFHAVRGGKNILDCAANARSTGEGRIRSVPFTDDSCDSAQSPSLCKFSEKWQLASFAVKLQEIAARVEAVAPEGFDAESGNANGNTPRFRSYAASPAAVLPSFINHRIKGRFGQFVRDQGSFDYLDSIIGPNVLSKEFGVLGVSLAGDDAGIWPKRAGEKRENADVSADI